jgi:hypothetical protein
MMVAEGEGEYESASIKKSIPSVAVDNKESLLSYTMVLAHGAEV